MRRYLDLESMCCPPVAVSNDEGECPGIVPPPILFLATQDPRAAPWEPPLMTNNGKALPLYLSTSALLLPLSQRSCLSVTIDCEEGKAVLCPFLHPQYLQSASRAGAQGTLAE